ncbi:putative gustatory receptor 28b [Uranotaenia lowii]|uniref:putative gustatory receptor 28b n=1 Tax=Uranotaenia lowii TaxID=190385 RepID=UPI00247A9C4B|nr:putative gustatory receptor 28b [Uranotaenia lowii]
MKIYQNPLKRKRAKPTPEAAKADELLDVQDENQFLLRHLRPLFLLSKLFSLAPYRMETQKGRSPDGKRVRISPLGIGQSLAAILLYGAFHLYNNYYDDFTGTSKAAGQHGGNGAAKHQENGSAAGNWSTSGSSGSEGNFVSVVIDVYNRYSVLVLYWILIAGNVANQRILIRCWEDCVQIDSIFRRKLRIWVNNSYWKRQIFSQMFLISGTVLVFEWFNCVMYLSDFDPASEYCLPQCYITLLTSIVAETQFVGFVKLLQMRFQLINQLLVRHQQDRIRVEIINDIKHLYAHLHLLSLNINRAFGVQLVAILLTLFVTITALLYYCLMKAIGILLQWTVLSHPDLIYRSYEVFSTLFWAMACAMRVFRICNVCNAAKNESKQIGCLIHALALSTRNQSAKSSIKLFSLQLLQQKVEFTACGLFNIDHVLVFNIIGSVTTYILILLQFDVAQNKSKWQRAH